MEFKPVENPAYSYTLITPIQYLGQAITEISIRAPTGGDMFRVGTPFKVKSVDPFDYDQDDAKAFAMLSRLSGLPIDGTLERLTPGDALAIFSFGMLPFFIPGYSPKPPAQPGSSQNTTAAA